MPGSTFQLELRPATLEHAGLVADLESARDPNEPRDPVLLRHWWRMADELEKTKRYIDVRDGAAEHAGARHRDTSVERGHGPGQGPEALRDVDRVRAGHSDHGALAPLDH